MKDGITTGGVPLRGDGAKFLTRSTVTSTVDIECQMTTATRSSRSRLTRIRSGLAGDGSRTVRGRWRSSIVASEKQDG